MGLEFAPWGDLASAAIRRRKGGEKKDRKGEGKYRKANVVMFIHLKEFLAKHGQLWAYIGRSFLAESSASFHIP